MLDFISSNRITRFFANIVVSILSFFLLYFLSDIIESNSINCSSIYILNLLSIFAVNIVLNFVYNMLDFGFLDNTFGLIFKNIFYFICLLFTILVTFMSIVMYFSEFDTNNIELTSNVIKGIVIGFIISPLLLILIFQKVSKNSDDEDTKTFSTLFPIISIISCNAVSIILSLILGDILILSKLTPIILSVIILVVIIIDIIISGFAFDNEYIDDRDFINMSNNLRNYNSNNSNISHNYDDESSDESSKTYDKNRLLSRSLRKLHSKLSSCALSYNTYEHYSKYNSYEGKVDYRVDYSSSINDKKGEFLISVRYNINELYGETDYVINANIKEFQNEIYEFIDKLKAKIEKDVNYYVSEISKNEECYELSNVFSCDIVVDNFKCVGKYDIY